MSLAQHGSGFAYVPFHTRHLDDPRPAAQKSQALLFLREAAHVFNSQIIVSTYAEEAFPLLYR